MDKPSTNVLFLCTGNSARSILAETLMNFLGNDLYHGHSAGSHPIGFVQPLTLELLKKYRLPIDKLRSKSWQEFMSADAPRMDYIITVCDSAAAEICPVWPGQPTSAHWSIPDPAIANGNDFEKRMMYEKVFSELQQHMSAFFGLSAKPINDQKIERLII